MSELRVITIPILPLGMINAFLVVTSRGRVLVDAGIPGSEDKIVGALRACGLTPRDLDLIVITHAHGDHAGSAARMRELSLAPVLAHATELPYYLQERPMTYCPTGWLGRIMKRSGRPMRGYEAFRPDILIDDNDAFDLSTFGVDGAVISTPGHTPGSLSVTLSERRVLAGDLVASGLLLGGIARTGIAKAPPFEEAPLVVARELTKLLDADYETFYLGHGGPLSASAVRRYVERVLREPRAA